jgi:hypothetical protein
VAWIYKKSYDIIKEYFTLFLERIMKKSLSVVRELDRRTYASLASIDPKFLRALMMELVLAVDDKKFQEMYDDLGDRSLLVLPDPQKLLEKTVKPFFVKEKDFNESGIDLPVFDLYPAAKIIICHFEDVNGRESIVVDRSW